MILGTYYNPRWATTCYTVSNYDVQCRVVRDEETDKQKLIRMASAFSQFYGDGGFLTGSPRKKKALSPRWWFKTKTDNLLMN